MTIDELKDKHFKVASYYWGDDKAHTEISIKFAIEILEDTARLCLADRSIIEDKIQELKQYLDEKEI